MSELEMSRMLSDIRERIARVEAKIDSMTDVRSTAEDAKEIAQEALQSTKSAHRRIDKIDKTIFWLGTTVIGAVITGIIAFWVKGV
jgi:methyl-accepting chemotaxis protein